MTLQVIGAGFGRTGTDSLRHALNMLGLGTCHHMHEVIPSEVQAERWLRKVRGEDIGWDTLFEGFGSAVDWPSAYYWRDMMDVYPDAKVVLTHRDPESWWQSYSKTILPSVQGLPADAMPSILLNTHVFPEGPAEKDYVLDVYKANIARFRAEVPKDRRIEVELGSGWGALCAGLGVDQPSDPYPSGNTTQEFRDRFSMD